MTMVMLIFDDKVDGCKMMEEIKEKSDSREIVVFKMDIYGDRDVNSSSALQTIIY